MKSLLTTLCFAALTTAAYPDQADFEALFNGENLDGWTDAKGWTAEDGELVVIEKGDNIFTEKEYENFHLRFEFNVAGGANSGVFIRRANLEIQLLDDFAEKHADLEDWQYSGSLYELAAPASRVSKKPGEWQSMEIKLAGQHLTITLNDTEIVNADLDELVEKSNHKGLKPGPGRIGFQNYNGTSVKLRNIKIREIE